VIGSRALLSCIRAVLIESSGGGGGGGEGLSLDAYIEDLPKGRGPRRRVFLLRYISYIFLVLLMLVKPQMEGREGGREGY